MLYYSSDKEPPKPWTGPKAGSNDAGCCSGDASGHLIYGLGSGMGRWGV